MKREILVNTTVRLPAATWELAKHAAVKRHCSLAELVGEAVRQMLESATQRDVPVDIPAAEKTMIKGG